MHFYNFNGHGKTSGMVQFRSCNELREYGFRFWAIKMGEKGENKRLEKKENFLSEVAPVPKKNKKKHH